MDHWLELGGERCFYRLLPAAASGSQRAPLLLIHGISCCTGTWEPFLQALAARGDTPPVIVPDLPAHGRTSRPDRVLNMDDFAGWANHLLDRLQVPRVDVMGHSMGCQVALALADRFPERVRRLVLLGPTTGGRHVTTLRCAVGLLADSVLEPLGYNSLLLRMFARMGPLRYLLTIREMQRDDAFARAAAIQHPLLVLQGTRDAIVPKWAGSALACTAPSGEYQQLAGAPHAAQFTHPHETAEAVLTFLARA